MRYPSLIAGFSFFVFGVLAGLMFAVGTPIQARGGRGGTVDGGLAGGGCSPGCFADINSNGSVDVNDLLAVITHWGACPITDADCDGWTVAQGDCDDNNPSVNPGASELCNGVDDNCNGRIDEGLNIGATCFTGLQGVCAVGTLVCGPSGEVLCQPVIAPGSTPEICGNFIDDNCDGQIDEGCP